MLMQYPYMQDGYQADERLYHDAQGRWLSPDPAGLAAVDLSNPQTLNRYVYANGDPANNTDPSGLLTCPPGFYVLPNGDGCGPTTSFIVVITDCAQAAAAYPGLVNCGTSHTSGASTGAGSGPAKSACIAPSSVQKRVLPIQADAARFWGKTLLAGVGVSGGAGLGKGVGGYASASVQIAVSPNGSAAYAMTFAAPASVTGAGTYAWVTPATKGLGFLGGLSLESPMYLTLHSWPGPA